MDIHFFKNIIEKIMISFKSNRVNSPSQKTKFFNKADRVGQKISQINYGLTYSETKNLIELVLDQNLTALKGEAEIIFQKRLDEFEEQLKSKIRELSPEEMSRLKEPDVQLTLLESAKIAGRKQDKQLRSVLADLVVKRIRNDIQGEEELKNTVYAEAVTTIDKLTVNQIRILTISYLLRCTMNRGISSWDAFNYYLNNHIKPFIDFRNTDAEFQHIQYTGCGSIEFGELVMPDLFMKQYPFLFIEHVDRDKIDELDFPEDVKTEIFNFSGHDKKYSFQVKSKAELESYLEVKSISEDSKKRLVLIYDKSISNKDAASSKLIEDTDLGKDIMGRWNVSALKSLSLTPVGIAIAISYFEQVVGESINIDLWIN